MKTTVSTLLVVSALFLFSQKSTDAATYCPSVSTSYTDGIVTYIWSCGGFWTNGNYCPLPGNLVGEQCVITGPNQCGCGGTM